MVYKGYTFSNQCELKKAIIINLKRAYLKIKRVKIFFLILTELIGVLTIFFAITTFVGYYDSFPAYERPTYEYYGGDAYTGIQNATVDSANNIAEMGDILKNYIYDFSFTMGGLLLVFGLLLIMVSTYQLIKTICSPIVLDKQYVESIMDEVMSSNYDVVPSSNRKADEIE